MIYAVPNVAAIVDQKLTSFFASKGIKWLPGTFGAIVNNIMVGYDLSEAIEGLKQATNKYDEASAVLRITTDVGMISMSLAEFGSLILLGNTLGPVGELATLVLIGSEMIAGAIIGEKKICERLGCSSQEARELFADILSGGSIPDYILNDLEAEEWYNVWLLQIRQLLVDSGYDAVVTTLPEIREIETLKFTGKALGHTTYRKHLAFCETNSISTNVTLSSPEKSSVDIKSFTDPKKYSPHSRILGDSLLGTNLVCNPTAQDIHKENIENIGCSDSSIVPCQQSSVSSLSDIKDANKKFEPTCRGKAGEVFTTVRSKMNLLNQKSNNKPVPHNDCSSSVVLMDSKAADKSEHDIRLLHSDIYLEQLPNQVQNIRPVRNNDKTIGGNNDDIFIVGKGVDNYDVDGNGGKNALHITDNIPRNSTSQVANIEKLFGTSEPQKVIVDNYVFSQSAISIIDLGGGGDEIEVYYDKINTDKALNIILHAKDTLILDSQDVSFKKAPTNIHIPSEEEGGISITLPLLGKRTLHDIKILLPYKIEQITIKYALEKGVPTLFLEIDDNGTARTIQIKNYGPDTSSFAHLILQEVLGQTQSIVELVPMIPIKSTGNKIIEEVQLKILIPTIFNEEQDFLFRNDLTLLKNDNHKISIFALTPDAKYIKESRTSNHIISLKQMENNQQLKKFVIATDPGGDTYVIDEVKEVLIETKNSKQKEINTILFDLKDKVDTDISQKGHDVIIKYSCRGQSGQVTLEDYCRQFNNKSFKIVKNNDATAYELISNDSRQLEIMAAKVEKVKLIPIPPEKPIITLSAAELVEHKILYLPNVDKASDLKYYKKEQMLILQVKNTKSHIIIYDFYSPGLKNEVQYSDISIRLATETLDAMQVYNETFNAKPYIGEIIQQLKNNYILFSPKTQPVSSVNKEISTECDNRKFINQPINTDKEGLINFSSDSFRDITFVKKGNANLQIRSLQSDSNSLGPVTEQCIQLNNWDVKKEHRGMLLTKEGGFDLSNCTASSLSGTTLIASYLTNDCVQKVFDLHQDASIDRSKSYPPENINRPKRALYKESEASKAQDSGDQNFASMNQEGAGVQHSQPLESAPARSAAAPHAQSYINWLVSKVVVPIYAAASFVAKQALNPFNNPSSSKTNIINEKEEGRAEEQEEKGVACRQTEDSSKADDNIHQSTEQERETVQDFFTRAVMRLNQNPYNEMPQADNLKPDNQCHTNPFNSCAYSFDVVQEKEQTVNIQQWLCTSKYGTSIVSPKADSPRMFYEKESFPYAKENCEVVRVKDKTPVIKCEGDYTQMVHKLSPEFHTKLQEEQAKRAALEKAGDQAYWYYYLAKKSGVTTIIEQLKNNSFKYGFIKGIKRTIKYTDNKLLEWLENNKMQMQEFLNPKVISETERVEYFELQAKLKKNLKCLIEEKFSNFVQNVEKLDDIKDQEKYMKHLEVYHFLLFNLLPNYHSLDTSAFSPVRYIEFEQMQELYQTIEEIRNDYNWIEHLLQADLQFRDNCGVKLIDTKPDGNCLFSAVSSQIGKTSETLRNEACKFLRRHKKDFKDFIHDKNFEEYLSDMKQDGTPGDHLMLTALASKYKINISVVRPDGSINTVSPFSENTDRYIVIGLIPSTEDRGNNEELHHYVIIGNSIIDNNKWNSILEDNRIHIEIEDNLESAPIDDNLLINAYDQILKDPDYLKHDYVKALGEFINH